MEGNRRKKFVVRVESRKIEEVLCRTCVYNRIYVLEVLYQRSLRLFLFFWKTSWKAKKNAIIDITSMGTYTNIVGYRH